MSTDPTLRFSNRVADYVRYRPRYPAAVLEVLRAEIGLRPEHTVVDVGSGTGFLTELFLAEGHRVYGVEPECRDACRRGAYLAQWSNFTSVNGARLRRRRSGRRWRISWSQRRPFTGFAARKRAGNLSASCGREAEWC